MRYRPRKRLVRLVQSELTGLGQAPWSPYMTRVLLLLIARCDQDNWIAGTQAQWSRDWGMARTMVTMACVTLQQAGLLEYHPRRPNGTRTWNQTQTAWRLSTRLVKPYTKPWWLRRGARARREG